jgi:hypothetical protein
MPALATLAIPDLKVKLSEKNSQGLKIGWKDTATPGEHFLETVQYGNGILPDGKVLQSIG